MEGGDVARKGHGGAIAPQTAVLPPTNSFEKNWLHLRLMYPQNVTGTNQNKFCFLRSQHCFVPHFHSSGAVSDCDG